MQWIARRTTCVNVPSIKRRRPSDRSRAGGYRRMSRRRSMQRSRCTTRTGPSDHEVTSLITSPEETPSKPYRSRVRLFHNPSQKTRSTLAEVHARAAVGTRFRRTTRSRRRNSRFRNPPLKRSGGRAVGFVRQPHMQPVWEAADGIRTHDLLHGKQLVGLNAYAECACKWATSAARERCRRCLGFHAKSREFPD
jgi:hypothetical protein